MEPILARFGLGDPEWLDPATSAVIVLISFAVALFFLKVVFPLIIRFTKWTPTDLDERMVRSARWPITLGILLLGVYLAVTLPLDLTESGEEAADTLAEALGGVLAIFMVVRLLSIVIDWHLTNLAARSSSDVEYRRLKLLRWVGIAVIYGIGGLLVLNALDFPFSPLLALVVPIATAGPAFAWLIPRLGVSPDLGISQDKVEFEAKDLAQEEIDRNPGLQPAELPDDLQQAINSALVYARFGAVSELARILRDSDAMHVRAARIALEQLADDDSRRVSGAVAETLGHT